MKTSIYKYLTKIILSVFIIIFSCSNALAKEIKVVSLAPDLTEIIYSINAQNSLVGVTTECSKNLDIKNIKKVGNAYFVNKEEILKLQPTHIFALSTTKPILGGLNNSNIQIQYFDFKTIKDIYTAIEKIGKTLNREKEAQKVIANIKNKIALYKTNKPKRILYLVQTSPYITVGNKSYITELITESGNISVTKDLNYSYPSVSLEYIAKTKPDIIVISFSSNIKLLKSVCPKSKIIFLDNNTKNIINRPSIKIHKGVEYFSKLY